MSEHNTDKIIFTTTCQVDDYGTISPSFKINPQDPYSYTSGNLKYFSIFKGKQVRVTIEILD